MIIPFGHLAWFFVIGCMQCMDECRARVDRVQTYKMIVNGLEWIDWYSGLQFVSDSRTRAAMSRSKRLKREDFQA